MFDPGDVPGPPPSETEPQQSPVEEDLAALRRELAQRNDHLLRLAADFDNFRRRKAQELADRSRYAAEEAARALLPVLDNLRRAVEHAPPGDEPAGGPEGAGQQLQDGLRMVVTQFEQALRSVGVEPVETVGVPFDPAVHEAISGEDSDAVSCETVIAEVQPGYRLHDRLLRPALVRVARPRAGGVTGPVTAGGTAPQPGAAAAGEPGGEGVPRHPASDGPVLPAGGDAE